MTESPWAYAVITVVLVLVLIAIVRGLLWLERKITDEVRPIAFNDGYNQGQLDLRAAQDAERKQMDSAREKRRIGAPSINFIEAQRPHGTYVPDGFELRRVPEPRGKATSIQEHDGRSNEPAK